VWTEELILIALSDDTFCLDTWQQQLIFSVSVSQKIMKVHRKMIQNSEDEVIADWQYWNEFDESWSWKMEAHGKGTWQTYVAVLYSQLSKQTSVLKDRC